MVGIFVFDGQLHGISNLAANFRSLHYSKGIIKVEYID